MKINNIFKETIFMNGNNLLIIIKLNRIVTYKSIDIFYYYYIINFKFN